VKPASAGENPPIIWTAAALPSVVGLAATPTELVLSDAPFVSLETEPLAPHHCPERTLVRNGTAHRVHLLAAFTPQRPCAAIPLDHLFDVRLAAARRLWLALRDRPHNSNSAPLSSTQLERLVRALRALDAHLDNATYREIATVLFGARRIPNHGWKTHDLRDRTIRLVRSGTELMKGGYRRLLLHPFRQRL
jgi:hypothetical protein